MVSSLKTICLENVCKGLQLKLHYELCKKYQIKIPSEIGDEILKYLIDFKIKIDIDDGGYSFEYENFNLKKLNDFFSMNKRKVHKKLTKMQVSIDFLAVMALNFYRLTNIEKLNFSLDRQSNLDIHAKSFENVSKIDFFLFENPGSTCSSF